VLSGCANRAGLVAAKTTAADLFRREIGEDVVVVPEAATLALQRRLSARRRARDVRRATQRAIYHVQKNLEDAHSAHYGRRILLCDRGTIDGAVYWPGDTEGFFQDLGTTFEKQLSRYDAVIFFETAAVGGISIEGGNPIRTESTDEAVALDRRLRNFVVKAPAVCSCTALSVFYEKDQFGPHGARKSRR
jgi:hypothetical protein